MGSGPLPVVNHDGSVWLLVSAVPAGSGALGPAVHFDAAHTGGLCHRASLIARDDSLVDGAGSGVGTDRCNREVCRSGYSVPRTRIDWFRLADVFHDRGRAHECPSAVGIGRAYV